jgi:hypothetical protein
MFEFLSNMYRLLKLPKVCLTKLENFQIKYGFEGFDDRNNFLYRNFLKFEMEFELQFKETSMV